MAGLSTLSFQTTIDNNYRISFDESICGMLFDISERTGVFDMIPLTASYFADGQVQVIRSISEATAMGLMDERLMNGLVAYHIKTYYEFIGKEQNLYIVFANCKENDKPDFSVIEDIQAAINGAIFQLGIWTEQDILDEELKPTQLINNIQYNVNELSNVGGSIGNGSTPLSVMLFPHIDEHTDYKALPDLINLSAPKVSVFIGQEGSDEVHAIQSSNVKHTPVGALGFALGVLTLAGAENSIADVGQFNLNIADNLRSPELGFGPNYSPIADIIEVRRNRIAMNGYIIFNTYDAVEAGVFFCNEQTLSYGEYDTISKNRLMHKAKRIIKRALLPRVNENILMDPSGNISATEIVAISNDIYEYLDANMVTRMGQKQIAGREVHIDPAQKVLENDTLMTKVELTTVTSSDKIQVEEGVILNT